LQEHPDSHSKRGEGEDDGCALSVQLDRFAWSEIELEAKRQGVSVDELARYALMYYLADLDRGAVSRRVPPRPSGGGQAAV
jgi:hypothetical protein